MSVILAAGKMLVKVAGPMLVEAGAKAVIDTVTDKVNEFRGKTVEVDGETYTEMKLIEIDYGENYGESDDSIYSEVMSVPAEMDDETISDMVKSYALAKMQENEQYVYHSWRNVNPEPLQDALRREYNQRFSKD